MKYECLECGNTFTDPSLRQTSKGMFEECPFCESENIEERDV